ncbi:MAG TPA: low molecular weight protein-tyrosine-phosphatase [Usitatibacteraceae bacterium]
MNISVLFVCMGNICRSPTAEGVFRKMVADSPLAGKIDIDSAGTHGYHVGSPPDARAVEHAAKRGYDLSPLRCRQVNATDFERFDYILAADAMNVKHLKAMCPTRLVHKIEYLLDYGGDEDAFEVPDPYQGEARDFELALDLIEEGCQGLLEYLGDQLRMRGTLPR